MGERLLSGKQERLNSKNGQVFVEMDIYFTTVEDVRSAKSLMRCEASCSSCALSSLTPPRVSLTPPRVSLTPPRVSAETEASRLARHCSNRSNKTKKSALYLLEPHARKRRQTHKLKV